MQEFYICYMLHKWVSRVCYSLFSALLTSFIIIKITKLTKVKIFWQDDVISAGTSLPYCISQGSPKKNNQ